MPTITLAIYQRASDSREYTFERDVQGMVDAVRALVTHKIAVEHGRQRGRGPVAWVLMVYEGARAHPSMIPPGIVRISDPMTREGVVRVRRDDDRGRVRKNYLGDLLEALFIMFEDVCTPEGAAGCSRAVLDAFGLRLWTPYHSELELQHLTAHQLGAINEIYDGILRTPSYRGIDAARSKAWIAQAGSGRYLLNVMLTLGTGYRLHFVINAKGQARFVQTSL